MLATCFAFRRPYTASWFCARRNMRKTSSKIRFRLAAPEPGVLRLIGDESRLKRTNTLSSRQIDQVIKATRATKKKR